MLEGIERMLWQNLTFCLWKGRIVFKCKNLFDLVYKSLDDISVERVNFWDQQDKR
jgi:hypothetical protein